MGTGHDPAIKHTGNDRAQERKLKKKTESLRVRERWEEEMKRKRGR